MFEPIYVIIVCISYIKIKIIFFFNRDEIAGCIEKAYERINFTEAARMLFFDSEKPMKNYYQEVRCIFLDIYQNILL